MFGLEFRVSGFSSNTRSPQTPNPQPQTRNRAAMRFTNLLPDQRSPVGNMLDRTGELASFIGRFFGRVWKPPYEWKETLAQMDEVGARSFLLVSVTGLAIGVVMAMQSRGTLAAFGAESYLPNMLTLTVVKEIGPVFTSLVLAGRLGAGIGAEIGSMRVTEQIDALEVAALKPFHYLVITRVVACVIVFPVLTVWADAIALLGGYFESFVVADTDYRIFFTMAFSSIRFEDLMMDTGKTAIFGFIVAIVSCYLGYNVRGGTREVGQAAMRAVVVSSLLILLADVIIVRLSLMLFGGVGSG